MPLGRVRTFGSEITAAEFHEFRTQLNRIEFQTKDANKRLFGLVLWVVFGAIFAGIMAPIMLAIAL